MSHLEPEGLTVWRFQQSEFDVLIIFLIYLIKKVIMI